MSEAVVSLILSRLIDIVSGLCSRVCHFYLGLRLHGGGGGGGRRGGRRGRRRGGRRGGRRVRPCDLDIEACVMPVDDVVVPVDDVVEAVLVIEGEVV